MAPVLSIPACARLARAAVHALRPQGIGLEPDWISIGLVLSIVGSFLLGNAILFRHPRVLVEEVFGKRAPRLHAIREYVFHRVQVAVGFTFLLAGLGLQLFGRFRPAAANGEPAFPVFWIGCIVLLTIALLFAGWWWSSRAFRRYVRAYFLQNPPDFETDMTLAREVGELFGIESDGDDTVQSYVERLRREIGLPVPDRQRRRGIAVLREEEVEVD